MNMADLVVKYAEPFCKGPLTDLPSLKNILHHLLVGVGGSPVKFIYLASAQSPSQRANILLCLL
jgi:hypothetical protein